MKKKPTTKSPKSKATSQRRSAGRNKKTNGTAKRTVRKKGEITILVSTPTIPHECHDSDQLNDEEEWVNLSNIHSGASGYSHTDIDRRYDESSLLIAKDFQFTTAEIPIGATIDGIVVTVTTSAIATGSAPLSDCVNQTLFLTITGDHVKAPGCTNHADDDALSDGSITKGSSTDMWGTSLMRANIVANTGFGVQFRCENYDNGKGLEGRVHSVSVTVHYTV